jgi:hypothetical protein
LSRPLRSSLVAIKRMQLRSNELNKVPGDPTSLDTLQPPSMPPKSEAPRPKLKNEVGEDIATSSSRLHLDRFHTVDTKDIPNGYPSVPVTFDENRTIYHTRMVAGSVRMQA